MKKRFGHYVKVYHRDNTAEQNRIVYFQFDHAGLIVRDHHTDPVRWAQNNNTKRLYFSNTVIRLGSFIHFQTGGPKLHATLHAYIFFLIQASHD